MESPEAIQVPHAPKAMTYMWKQQHATTLVDPELHLIRDGTRGFDDVGLC